MTDAPIPAATVIIARDRPNGSCEVLMVERAEGMAFAAGAMVFPGGRIDDADRAFADEIGAEAALVAAVRESLEETAIPIGISPLPDPSRARDMQEALLADRPIGEVLAAHGASLEPGALIPFARWVPKFHAVRRFDTLFYLAACPPGEWEPRVVEAECAAAEWVRPADVLDRERSGAARLIFPTRRTLERLAQHVSVEALITDARAHRIEPITPWVEERNGEKYITIPADLGFPVTEERLDGLWRG